MTDLNALYVIISGATTARRMPGLIERLAGRYPQIVTVLTENAHRVVSPRELSLVGGNTVVESYFDDVILPRPPDGLVLVAPCTFNSLNKLAHGVADSLALSIAAEAIGRGTPVVVAVSVNPPLWNHPLARQSVETLRSWGLTVIEPVVHQDTMALAADDDILCAVEAAWSRASEEP